MMKSGQLKLWPPARLRVLFSALQASAQFPQPTQRRRSMTIPSLAIFILLQHRVAKSGFLNLDARESAVAGCRSAQPIVVVDQNLIVVAAPGRGLRIILRGNTAVSPVSLAVALGDRAGTHAFPEPELGDDRASHGRDPDGIAGFEFE